MIIHFFSIFVFVKLHIVNQDNTIKSIIPQRLLKLVPASIRDRWADRIVELFKQDNPQLYRDMGQWVSIPEEKLELVTNGVVASIEKVHKEFRDEE